MLQTARQTDKTTRWQFTAYEDQFPIIDAIEREIDRAKEWDSITWKLLKYQTEICPDTGRKHRQGALQTAKQMRFNAMSRLLPGIHLEHCRNWNALLKYCEKTDTRDSTERRVDKFTESRPIRIDELMHEFAMIWWDYNTCGLCGYLDGEDENRQEHKKCEVKFTNPGYWQLANVFINTYPHLSGLVAQPMPQNLWKNTRTTWLNKALISITSARLAEHLGLAPPGTDDSPSAEINEIVYDNLISVPQISNAPPPPPLSPSSLSEEESSSSSESS